MAGKAVKQVVLENNAMQQSRQVFSKDDVRDLIAARAGADKVPKKFKVITDTSDFFRIEYNDVVLLGGRPFWAKRYEKEGRFGIDNQPKYWVRRAVDLLDSSTSILKLVFHEQFTTTIDNLVITCFRSPQKEARILGLVADHKNFMHGYSVLDAAGNNVRILEFIRGQRFDEVVEGCEGDHRSYFLERLPDFLDQYIELVKAIKFLHDRGEKHGDIRRDHILIDRHTGRYRWIDFDFNYRHRENVYGYDLFGLGNVLVFLVGMGDVLLPELKKRGQPALDRLADEDLNIVFNHRVANLKKIYPYIPESLNRILMHFSKGANWFYENTVQLLDDLGAYRASTRTP